MRNDQFRNYQERHITFHEQVAAGNWVVKIYTISPKASFESEEVLKSVKSKLPTLLEEASNHHHSAFLIVHEGTDGVWSLVNWWTGREMLRTKTYFTSFQEKERLSLLPANGSLACVWELPLINHEKNAWVKHILKKPSQPAFEDYYQDFMEGKV